MRRINPSAVGPDDVTRRDRNTVDMLRPSLGQFGQFVHPHFPVFLRARETIGSKDIPDCAGRIIGRQGVQGHHPVPWRISKDRTRAARSGCRSDQRTPPPGESRRGPGEDSPSRPSYCRKPECSGPRPHRSRCGNCRESARHARTRPRRTLPSPVRSMTPRPQRYPDPEFPAVAVCHGREIPPAPWICHRTPLSRRRSLSALAASTISLTTLSGNRKDPGCKATATQGASGVEWRRTASMHSSISADFPAPGAPWKTIVPPPTRPSWRLPAALRKTLNSVSRPRKNGSRPTSERSVWSSHVSSGKGSAGGGFGKGLSFIRMILPQRPGKYTDNQGRSAGRGTMSASADCYP